MSVAFQLGDSTEPHFRDCDPVFRPRSVAIVGASETGGAGWPRRVYENLEFAGYSGELFLVNPRRSELWGRPCFPDLAAIPEPVDLAITVIPADHIPDALEAGLSNGLKGALVFASQFGEGGDAAGAARAERLRALSRNHDLRICGPNCMGTLAIREGHLFYPSPRVRSLSPGPVGVVFQSGGTFMYWLRQAAVRGLGFSYAVSSGNEIDLDLADYVNFLVEDDSTRLIVCMVEGVRRPAAFVAAAERALAAGKPVLLVKIGRSQRGAAQARSHTGALAGDDRLFDAVCARLGIVRCHSLDDLIEHALAFQAGRFPSGGRVGMACYSGGAKGLFLDYADEAGLALPPFAPETEERLREQIDPGLSPENPLDAGAGPATMHERYGRICETIAADPNVDILALQAQLPESDADRSDPGVYRRLADSTGKPVLAIARLSQNVGDLGRGFQKEAGIPFLQGLPEACRVLASLDHYGRTLRQGIAPVPPPAGLDLPEGDLERLLAEAGVRFPRERRAADAAAAAEAAAEIGFPVALKIVSPQASHKTEIGGVALGLAGKDAVRAAAQAMAERLEAAVPGAEIAGFLVQEMVQGLEVLVGFRNDPGYGPYLVFGLGGVLVEAIRDVTFRMLPIEAADVERMIGELRSAALFGSYRGRPAPDVPALTEAVLSAAHFFMRHRDRLADLEINPLIVLPAGGGVRAVDLRAVRAG
ncbi:acetate--CoA ligase family protein [Propylenella binzhouense]|nr:acetate--CoA ligase family protein [Propylenella binzhouense]